jgi:hypothetical protein
LPMHHQDIAFNGMTKRNAGRCLGVESGGRGI